MTATVIPFPSKSVREAVLEARKDAEVVRRYTKRPDGWRYLPALANAEQCVRQALERTDLQPIPRKIRAGGVVSGGGREQGLSPRRQTEGPASCVQAQGADPRQNLMNPLRPIKGGPRRAI